MQFIKEINKMKKIITVVLIAICIFCDLPAYSADVARTNPQTGVTQGYAQKTIGNNTTLVPYMKEENQLTVLDTLDATTGWAAFNTDATGLATTTSHTLGTLALTFDKADGAANTTIGAIAKTLSSVNLSNYTLDDFITISFLIPSLTDVDKVFIRLGTSSSHYNEWQVDDSDLTANVWLTANIPIGSVTSVTGDGWNPSDVDYIVVGATFDAETNTLTGLIFDDVAVNGAQLTPGVLTGTAGTASDVNLQQYNGAAVGAGNALHVQPGTAATFTVLGNVADGMATAGNPLLIAGDDGTNVQYISTDTDGDLQVDVLTSTVTTFPDNEPFNLAQVAGNTLVTGNGVTGTGSPRVTISSDNTPFPVKIDQTTPGTTNLVQITDGAGAVNTIVDSGTITANAGTGTFVVGDGAGALNVIIDSGAITETNSGNIATDTDSLAVVGNGAAATAQRVTLASDSTGIVALTTSTASIGKLAANSGVDIGDVDVTSVIPGTGATNLGKAIDTATGATDTGVLALFTRDDALSALTPIETDNVQGRTDANGAIWTHDDALDAALAGSELQVDVVASLPAGTNAIGKLAANSGVDIGDVDVTSIAAGANVIGKVGIDQTTPGTTNLVQVTDGSGALNTIIDSGTVTANAGTGTFTVGDGAGALNVIVDSGTTAVTQATASSLNAEVVGDTAHDAASLATNPVTIGGEAINTDGTAAPNAVSAEGDTVRATFDLYGRQLVSNQHPNSWCASEEETVAVTADEIKAAPGANLSLYVCSFIISNGATAGTYSLDEDSGGTPGILVPNIYTAVNGGAVINLDPCYRVAANQEIGVTSVTVTTGSYTVCGYTAP